MVRHARESETGASRSAKEIDENTFVGRGVLIDEDADGFVASERTQDGARGVFLLNDVVAGETPTGLDQPVNARIIQRPNDDVHWLGHKRMRECAQLPIAQMGCGKQNALAATLRLQEVLDS